MNKSKEELVAQKLSRLESSQCSNTVLVYQNDILVSCNPLQILFMSNLYKSV